MSRPALRKLALTRWIAAPIAVVILVVFTASRFSSVGVDARVASMRALAGSLQASAAHVHGLAVAGGVAGPTGSLVLHESTISLIDGFPDASATGIEAVLRNLDDFEVRHAPPHTTFRLRSLDPGTRCVVDYDATTGAVDLSQVNTTTCR